MYLNQRNMGQLQKVPKLFNKNNLPLLSVMEPIYSNIVFCKPGVDAVQVNML